MKDIRYIIGCLLVWLVSCQQHEVVNSMEELAELTFKLDLADNGSRGLPDGDCLDVVSVYLVDANKNIVARQENITVANNATEVEVTFGKSYNLVRGMYTLMAVANHGTLNSFASADYDALMNNQVHATGGTGNISPKNVIQPLSLMKEIELHAGDNQIEGELVRTFARFRIEVKNNSGSFPLKISNLTFSDNFTQKQAYVFDDGTDRKYFEDKGAPLSNSSHAMIPFSATTIDAQSSRVLFDSYLLESKVTEGDRYEYTLDLKYEGVTIPSYSYKILNTNSINSVNNLNVGTESYFLIYNSNSTQYLSSGEENVTTSKFQFSNGSEMATPNVWQLEKAGNNTYYIKSVSNGLYIQQPKKNTVISLGSTPVAFTFENKQVQNWWISENYIAIKKSSYISVDNTSVKGSDSDNSSACYFRFYSVDKVQGNQTIVDEIHDNTPIKLTTINPITQQSSFTAAIKRSDFINVLVTVSYNPVAGKFEFVVQDWNTGAGNVEFN